MLSTLFVSFAFVSVAFASEPSGYVVLADAGPTGEYRAAAQALADFHRAPVVPFQAEKLDEAFAELKKRQPEFVVFVLPPEKIDVDLVHRILERAVRLDEDPFVDFEHGFVTGKDGAAALRFVERIKAAWKKDYARTAGFYGTWEGPSLPVVRSLSAFKALKLEAEFRLVHVKADEAARRRAAQEGLAALKDKAALLFFSHGHPHEMAGCFTAADLRAWKPDFSGAVLVNCSCWNGCPGRWWGPGPRGPQDNGVVQKEASVCLEILDSGTPAYLAGAAPWHGPLAIQAFGHIVDDGLRLGEAAKRLHDRLALDFLPERIAFPPTAEVKDRFSGEGSVNRRHNGAAMILYGDPAWAPFAKGAPRLAAAELKRGPDGKLQGKLTWKPQLEGAPDQDFLLPMHRLTDYYSAKSNDLLKELSLELRAVAAAPAGLQSAPALAVKSATCGGQRVPAKAPQAVLEERHGQRFLQLRVPLDVRAVGSSWPMALAAKGVEIELEEARGSGAAAVTPAARP